MSIRSEDGAGIGAGAGAAEEEEEESESDTSTATKRKAKLAKRRSSKASTAVRRASTSVSSSRAGDEVNWEGMKIAEIKTQLRKKGVKLPPAEKWTKADWIMFAKKNA